jgi:hypothetical protein
MKIETSEVCLISKNVVTKYVHSALLLLLFSILMQKGKENGNLQVRTTDKGIAESL